MQITELAVKRPVTTIMFFVGVIIMGMISLFKTPRELLPSLTYPQITVITLYENATPEEIEKLVTKVIEDTVGTVSRLKGVSSISREGLSLVMAEFNWGTNMDFASMDVREKIDLIKGRLPRNCQEPIVMKFNPFELPVMSILISSRSGKTDPESLYKMKQIVENVIKNNLEKLDGVASVEIKGGREREIVVEVDQTRLGSTEVSLLEIVDILKKANLAYPAGTIKKRFYEYLIRSMGEYETIEDIKNTPVRVQYFEEIEIPWLAMLSEETPKGIIHLSDVARVTDTFKKQESIFRHNNEESLSVSVKKQSGANIIKLTKLIRKKMEELSTKLPNDYRVKIVYDQSEFVEESIKGVADSAIQGGVLAFFILLIFMKNIKNSIIVSVTIPVSLVGTFILMYFQKITINMMSLGGLALGVGMLVDNSIVVLENIYRKNIEENKGPELSAIEGTVEVGGAITSSTLTTITVFFPFIFLAGVAGQLFKELAYTVTYSLVTSLGVAISLVPRLTSANKGGKYEEPAWGEVMKDYYSRMLTVFLSKRLFFYFIITAMFFGSIVLLLRLNKEFMPQTEQREFMVKIELPPGTQLEATDRLVRQIEAAIASVPEVGDITTTIGSSKGSSGSVGYSIMGPNQAEIMVQSKGEENFKEETIEKVKDRVSLISFEGEIEYVTQAGVLGAAIGGGAPVSVEVMGEDMNTLIEISEIIKDRFNANPNIYGVKTSFRGYRPELKMEVNKDRASLYDISTENVTVTAQTAIKGYVATKLKEEDNQIDIKVSLMGTESKDFDRIGQILVHSPLKFDVELNQLVDFVEDESSSEIRRKEGQKIITVSGNYIGTTLSKVLMAVEEDIQDMVQQYPAYTIEIAGEREKMKESFASLIFVLVLALVFVYMIMAAQFESLWQPFIIIITVPLSIIGVAIFLFITGTSLNVVVLLGITMLGGIVVNNGIVLISHYNEIDKAAGGAQEGADRLQTILKGSLTRLRPVLMTALTTILGLIPMAIAGGQGSEMRAPLAVTVIGGLLVSTFLTLFVIPGIFLDSERFIKKMKTEWMKKLMDKISW
ncbi:MAG: efflux RND transporter permease subunit [Elusimicrobia bacterium]|nr:efflux RND transporter permease subunit [Elusimicrobiota bacterium]